MVLMSLLCKPWQGCFDVDLGDAPANKDFPMGPFSNLLVEPDCTADVTGKQDDTFFDRSSCSLLPGTGVSSVDHMVPMFGVLLTRANIASDYWI